MKSKFIFFAGLACLACLVIGMIAGSLIERRHLNIWFSEEDRAELREAIEKARRMMAELEEIRIELEAMNEEARKMIILNKMMIIPRPSKGD